MRDYTIYIVCHNEAAVSVAMLAKEKMVSLNGRFEILQVSDSSPYFETQAFEKLEKLQDEWNEKEYVGIITYSFFEKMKSVNVDFDKIIEEGIATSMDVCPILNIDFYKPRTQVGVSFIESISFQHGTFMWHIMYNILKTVGRYSDDKIFDKTMNGFISNWWIAKPSWMKRYIAFVKKAIRYLEANAVLSSMVKEQAYYKGVKTEGRDNIDTERLMKLFGKPYYTLEPFIFERLPVLFFHIEQANIMPSKHRIKWALLD